MAQHGRMTKKVRPRRMGAIFLRVPSDLKSELKAACALKEETMTVRIVSMIREFVERSKLGQ